MDPLNTTQSTDCGREALDLTIGSLCDLGVQPRLNRSINEQLCKLASRYEIQCAQLFRLRQLEKFKIVILCDDSGSMMELVDGYNRTRWDELRDIVKLVVTVSSIFDMNGVHIYFLNREDKSGVKDPNEIDQLFVDPPSGYTTLVSSVRHILQLEEAQDNNDKRLLLFIATDGYPTNDAGEPNLSEFEHVIGVERKWETTYLSFLVCTDDRECVDYLSNFDQTMKNVDVTDDFETEKKKIRKYQGVNFPFSKGDYIIKALVGAIDPEIDQLNEPNQTRNG